jgi:hypothetical protein
MARSAHVTPRVLLIASIVSAEVAQSRWIEQRDFSRLVCLLELQHSLCWLARFDVFNFGHTNPLGLQQSTPQQLSTGSSIPFARQEMHTGKASD